MLYDFYILCALLGGTVVVLQLILSLLGIGAGHAFRLHLPHFAHHGIGHAAPAGAHHAAATPSASHPSAHATNHTSTSKNVHSSIHDHWAIYYLLALLNVQSIIAGIAVFGLAGLAASAAHVSASTSLAIAAASALLMMAMVTAAMRLLVGMDRDGTINIANAVGAIGTVYLTIPPKGQGQGKVTLPLQQRLMEFAAITPADTALPAGQQIIVIAVRGTSTMEVISAENRPRDLQPASEGAVTR